MPLRENGFLKHVLGDSVTEIRSHRLVVAVTRNLKLNLFDETCAKNPKNFSANGKQKENKMKTSHLVAMLAVAPLAVSLTGCVGYVEHRPAYGYSRPYTRAEYVEDDYVYYPQYELYYGNRSHRYYSRQGSSWVVRPTPPGISVNALISVPSVHLDFHDHPSRHHAEICRSYPRHWAPPGHDRDRDRR